MKGVMMKEKECAEYLGFSVKKLRTMRKNNEIPFYVLGGNYYYKTTMIDAWIEQQLVSELV